MRGCAQIVELADDLNDKVTAIGPDADAGDCRFFLCVLISPLFAVGRANELKSDFNCVDNNGWRHFDLSTPGKFLDISLCEDFKLIVIGTPNLANTNPGANDQVSSYICFG